jgi:DNA replication protein DnaC
MTKKPSNPMPVLTIPKLSEGQLEPLFRRLNLAHTRRIYLEVADRAEKENWTYRDFLALLLAEEVAHRKQTRLQRCTRQAHFPFFKTIDEFDFTLQSTLRQSLLGSYLGPDFVTEGRSLILYGKAGRGKTHLAVAIGYRAIQNGFDTVCTTAAKLIEDLSNASAKGLLQQSLPTYTRPHVLVIDEIGYLSYGPDAANVLFHVVNDRHLRKRPMIFTTNKPLSEWGKVLHDEDLAAAILDRVLERGRFLPLDGPSGRTRHLNLEEVSPSKAERLRISGINGSEFPEPTWSRSNSAICFVGSNLQCASLKQVDQAKNSEGPPNPVAISPGPLGATATTGPQCILCQMDRMLIDKGAQGAFTITLTITIAKNGTVTNVESDGAPTPEIKSRIEQQAQQWLFEPYLKDGERVNVKLNTTVHVNVIKPR